MVKRYCRDCQVPNCGAKYLVRLANHLADVHLLDIEQRRQYLQEAKLQPKIKSVDYQADEQSTRNYQIQKKANSESAKCLRNSKTSHHNSRGKSWLTIDWE